MTIIMGITSESTCYRHSTYLIPECLKHPHEFLIHITMATTTPAGHLRTAEVGGDHVSHEHPGGYEECASGNYKPTALQFPVRFKFGADFGDYLIIKVC